MMAKLRAILELGRISNLPTVMTNVFAVWMLSGALGWWSADLAWVMAGSCFLYLGGTTLNDAFDVEFDRKHRPERAIPSGVLTLEQVWTIGLFHMFFGGGILMLFTRAPVWSVMALVGAIVVYDWIHKKSPAGVFFMGLCRFCLYLMAGLAFTSGLASGMSKSILIWGGVLFLYIIGLTFTARGESTGAGHHRWSLVLLLTPLIAWFVATGHPFHWLGIATAVLFLVWTVYALSLLRGSAADRIGKSVSAMLAGIILVDALAVSTVCPEASVVLLAVLPLTLGFQRWIAPT